MESVEKIFLILLAIVNLCTGLGCAILIAKLFVNVETKSITFFRCYVILISVYFVECVAFPVGMATQVFTVGLAFVWGTILGLWLRTHTSVRDSVRLSIFVALYSSLPTVSFCILLPLIMTLAGGDVLNVEKSGSFGIPSFLPWPLNTILGFFGALMIGTVILKTVITAGSVWWLIRRWEQSSKLQFQ